MAASGKVATASGDRRRRVWRGRLPALGTAVSLLLLWQVIVSGFGVPTYIAPSPLQVVGVFVEKGDILWINFLPTLFEAAAGFVLGNSVPILVLMLGNGFAPKIVIASLICFFPTLVNMVRGLKAVSPQMLELMQVLSATNPEILWKVRIHSSLPFLFAALKIASTTCVIGAIVGEWIGSNYGLGALIIEATYNFRSPMLYATVILGASMAVAGFAATTIAERRFVKWKPGAVH